MIASKFEIPVPALELPGLELPGQFQADPVRSRGILSTSYPLPGGSTSRAETRLPLKKYQMIVFAQRSYSLMSMLRREGCFSEVVYARTL
jgi:hypothetical protein